MNKFIVGFFLLFLFYVVLIFTLPLALFSPWFKWWKTHQIENQTVSCMPLNLLAYSSASNIQYDIASLFLTNENQTLSYAWQPLFLLGMLGTYGKDVSPNGQLTPFGCCRSIAPQPHDAILFEVKPDVQGPKGRYTGPSFSKWPLEIDTDKGSFKNQTIEDLWLGVLASWGCYMAGDGKPAPLDQSTWEHPSNFLFHQYNIPQNSLICQAFAIGSANDPSTDTKWFPDTLKVLLGLSGESGEGGWFGFMKSGGDWGGFGLFGMERQIWAQNATSAPSAGAGKPSCSGAQWASAGAQGLNMGAMALMLGAAALPIWGLVVAGIAGTLIGGGLGLAQTSCKLV
jgi:hypothetical protein